jgi:hypothetical protein
MGAAIAAHAADAGRRAGLGMGLATLLLLGCGGADATPDADGVADATTSGRGAEAAGASDSGAGSLGPDAAVATDASTGDRGDASVGAGDRDAALAGTDAAVAAMAEDPYRWQQLSAGNAFTCGLRKDGVINCWGDGRAGQTVTPEGTFTSVSSGANHSCAVRTDGEAVCWGWALTEAALTPPPGPFVQVDADGEHSCGVRRDGRVECWGRNMRGETIPPDARFTYVEVRWQQSCGLTVDGHVLCWGLDVESPTGTFKHFSLGDGYGCGVREDDTPECWGSGPLTTMLVFRDTVTQFAAADGHLCYLVHVEGRVGSRPYCAGHTGARTNIPSTTPFVAVTCGDGFDGGHCCGLTEDERAICWGEASYGQAAPPSWDPDRYATDWPLHLIEGDCNGVAFAIPYDVDGDGALDIVASCPGAHVISWWRNPGRGVGRWLEHNIAAAFRGVAEIVLRDMDGDGDADVVAAADAANEVAWFENHGGDGLTWTKHAITTAFDGAIRLDARDMDGDGDNDVIAIARNVSQIRWWENLDGTGTSFAQHVVGTTGTPGFAIVVADFDGDGDMDVLGSHAGPPGQPGEITYFRNDGLGTSFTARRLSVAGQNTVARAMLAVDLDGDGALDILFGDDWARTLSWYRNEAGDGSTWLREDLSETPVVRQISVIDYDGDGDLDVLGVSSNRDLGYLLWENVDPQAVTFSRHILRSGEASLLTTGDLDGDGDPDLLGANGLRADLFYWER